MFAKDISIPSAKIKYGLSRTTDFLSICKNPENNFFSIQILGTNGKGTVAAILSQILIDAGYKVGTYSSPHLVHINERIRINNKNILDSEIKFFLDNFYNKAKSICPSFFELMTVMAMWYFSKEKVDFAVLETGLGGRLDSVTACKNSILGFTSISMDHHEILGNTMQKIAKEKAMAINSSQQVCLSVNQELGIKRVLIRQAEKTSTKIKFVKKQEAYQFKYLYGFHNQQNAELAKAIIVELNKTQKTNITNAAINKSVFNTKWEGRFQILQKHPTIIYDVAHNKSSLTCFINSFATFNKANNYEKKYIILAFEENKKIRTVLKKFEKHFNFIICSETNIRKSMKCEDIKKIFLKKAVIKKSLDKAIISTIKKANKKDCIVILGSHYIGPTLNNIFKNCFVHK